MLELENLRGQRRGKCPRCGAPVEAKLLIRIDRVEDGKVNPTSGNSKTRSRNLCSNCTVEMWDRMLDILEEGR